jgi:hypothetical protein
MVIGSGINSFITLPSFIKSSLVELIRYGEAEF